MALRRINKELKDITKPSNCGPTGTDLFHWQAVVIGPEDTPYAGGEFYVDVQIPTDYR
jgi:ubiquitin-conjugating enzyme E2 D/E